MNMRRRAKMQMTAEVLRRQLGLPEGTIFRGVKHDVDRDIFTFLVNHDELQEVFEGSESPQVVYMNDSWGQKVI